MKKIILMVLAMTTLSYERILRLLQFRYGLVLVRFLKMTGKEDFPTFLNICFLMEQNTQNPVR